MLRLTHSHRHLMGALLAFGLAFALPACADITAGVGARSVAMGGAGLASGDTAEAAVNPAFLADTGMRFGVEWPTVDTRYSGAAGIGDAFNLLGRRSLDPVRAFNLVKDLGTDPTEIDSYANAGVLLPKADLRVSASLRTIITPNVDFSNWVRNGGTLADAAQADVKAVGITNLPSLGFGFHLSGDESPFITAVGMRVKPTQAYYSHYLFSAANLDANGRPLATPAAEMDGRSYLKATSLSADLGVTLRPRRVPNLCVALVVNNLLEPKAIKFSSAAANGLMDAQVAPRTVSLGTAWVNNNLTLAADLVDLTNSFDQSHLRLGAELRMPMSLALRGGYNSHYGMTAGVGFGNWGLAYSQKTPLMISNSISF